jgi:hypothetical protein
MTGGGTWAPTLLAADIRLEESPSGSILSGRLEARGASLPDAIPRTLWFMLPPGVAREGASNGDPFLPVLLVCAMHHGIPQVAIEADVSAALLESGREIGRVFHAWSARVGDTLRAASVSAPAVQRVRRGTASAAFFSGGVDSFFTVLRNASRYPAGDPRLITHLVLIDGFDVQLDDPFFSRVETHCRLAAEELGKELVVVRSNARQVLAGVDWNRYGHGPMLAAVGLALSEQFHTMLIPSGRAVLEPFKPTASHPGLDPLWSTEAIEFVHDGAEATRTQKVRRLAGSSAALRHLRVCWENRDGAYNCARCEKCVRTMVLLKLAGALDQTSQFPSRLDPIDVEAAVHRRPDVWPRLLEAIRQAAPDQTDWSPIVEAIERAFARMDWAQSRVGRVDAAASGWLARVGLSPARAKTLDALWLGGRARRGLQALQRALRKRGQGN